MTRARCRLLVACVLAGLLAACDHDHATAEDCRAILDHIIDHELRERGFRDPALAARKRAELAGLFAADLRRCVGRPLPRGAMECLRTATTNEDLSHRCLR